MINTTITNVNLTDIQNGNEYLSYDKGSYFHFISNFTVKTRNKSVLRFVQSEIERIENMHMEDVKKNCIKVERSQINLITDSVFNVTGSAGFLYGCFWIFNGNVTINNSLFLNNTSKNGASISAYCSNAPYCLNKLENTTFQYGNGTVAGGAIYYDIYRPIMNNMTFINNTSPYGPNIASYPVKLIVNGTNSTSLSLTDLVSGQPHGYSLTFNVVDYDNQVTTDELFGYVTINTLSPGTSVRGRISEPLVNGSATFDEIIFIGPPGSKELEFKVTSNAIDASKLMKQFGKASIQDPMKVSFRYCKPGESIVNNQCSTCIAGTYSLKWNSTECHRCMDNASWLGGTEIYVDKGYWRKSMNSSDIIECLLEDAWQGEYHPENENPIKCSEGYDGILWTEWVFSKGEKYERLTNFEWLKCPSLLFNTLRMAGLLLIVWAFFFLVIFVNVRKKKESQQSILLRIFANYMQLLTAALSFNLKFPDAITDAFYPAERIGASSEAFLSFDWFVKDTEIKAFAPSNAIFKVMLTGLLPIALTLIAVLSWTIISLFAKRFRKEIYRNIVVTIICILYLLHPMLTKVALEMFQCVQTDKDEYRVRIDIDII